MKKVMFLAAISAIGLTVSACAPITIQKCTDEYTYEGDKVKTHYHECITQVPEKTFPIHLRNKQMYE